MYFSNGYYFFIIALFIITLAFMAYVERWYEKRRPTGYYNGRDDRALIRANSRDHIILSIELLLFGIPAVVENDVVLGLIGIFVTIFALGWMYISFARFLTCKGPRSDWPFD